GSVHRLRHTDSTVHMSLINIRDPAGDLAKPLHNVAKHAIAFLGDALNLGLNTLLIADSVEDGGNQLRDHDGFANNLSVGLAFHVAFDCRVATEAQGSAIAAPFLHTVDNVFRHSFAGRVVRHSQILL